MLRESAAPSRVAGTSPQQLRQSNVRVVLDIFWDSPTGSVLTAGELIERSGLTRATVLGVCDDLIALGWVREVEPALPKAVVRGRRPRHFTFRSDAGYVVGIDVGFLSVTAVVANLQGAMIGRGRHTFPADDLSPNRLKHVRAVVRDALNEADVTVESVSAVCLGVAAPVDRNGNPPAGNPYWELVRINPAHVIENRQGWPALIENDANLAARAEQARGTVDPDSSFVTVLAGERLGAGVVAEGALLRGHHGGTGELEYLERVEGVGGPEGIGALARTWADEGLAAGEPSALNAVWNPEEGRPSAEDVFAAAALNDPLALDIVERLGKRFAIAFSTIASLLNPQTVVIAGGVAQACGPVIKAIEERIGRYSRVPPKIVASRLGADVVLIGAVHTAVEYVRDHALDAVG